MLPVLSTCLLRKECTVKLRDKQRVPFTTGVKRTRQQLVLRNSAVGELVTQGLQSLVGGKRTLGRSLRSVGRGGGRLLHGLSLIHI